MSMLGERIKELHEMADTMHRRSREIGLDYGMGRGLADASRMLREAADTIISLRNRLQELQGEVNHWRTEQVHAYGNWEDAYKRVIELEANNGTRWHELFGTPERAARTIAAMMDKCSDRPHGCDGCMLFDVCDDEANVLEWLKGDA